jgi:hypothetical protein
MKKLLVSALLLHATANMHFAQANSVTETISSTASLIFSAKVLIPVTLGTALYYSLAYNAKLLQLNYDYESKYRKKYKKQKAANQDLLQRAVYAETQNKILLAALDAFKTNNADALIKTLIQKK